MCHSFAGPMPIAGRWVTMPGRRSGAGPVDGGLGRGLMAAEGRARLSAARELAPSRVIIEGVNPEIDHGRFPIKRTVGEEVVVSADVFAEGHDAVVAVLRHRKVGVPQWDEAPMTALVNDRWTG